MGRSEQSRKKAAGPCFVCDYTLLVPVLLLVGIGVAMIYSASCEIALKQFGNEYYFFKKQLIFAGLGVMVMLMIRFIPYRVYRPLTYLIFITAIVLLSVLLINGVGHASGGATRWLKLKWVSFQPTEFAKLALIIFMAYSLSKKQDRIEELNIGFLPHVLILCLLSGLIILQPDFGSIAIMWMLAWVVMFAGRVRVLHLTVTILMILPVATYLIVSSEYRLKRFLVFLDPWRYPLDEGYQIIHSLMAFGSGGLLGKGFGQGYQKLFYLPTPHTDFILSVIGEEGGWLWILIVLGLYLIILWRGIEIARARTDFFGSLLALGISAAIALQAVVNMGVNLSLLPTKGLTLPFLSYGGTSLLINMVLIGILMNIGMTRAK
ncbi:MAG: putative lipid II flippase FtsW [Desulfobacterales bacterium]|nr:putative lipid II flippase FtsW [Desulfobacterales bacterium]